MTCDDVKGLAYVRPEALSEAERSALTAHLEVCPPCHAEYQQIRAVGDALLAAVPAHPPAPHVRQLLAARLAQKVQHFAPSKVQFVSANPHTPALLRNWLQQIYDWLFRPSVTLPRGAVFAAAALCLALVVSGVSQRQQLQQQAVLLQAEADEQQRILALMSDPSLQQVRLVGVGEAANSLANLRFDPATNAAVLLIRDLPTLPPDKNYQLWLAYGDDARDTGAVFACDQSGSKVRTFLITAPRQFNAYVRFGVTIEPAGGSPRPTGPRAYSASL